MNKSILDKKHWGSVCKRILVPKCTLLTEGIFEVYDRDKRVTWRGSIQLVKGRIIGTESSKMGTRDFDVSRAEWNERFISSDGNIIQHSKRALRGKSTITTQVKSGDVIEEYSNDNYFAPRY